MDGRAPLGDFWTAGRVLQRLRPPDPPDAAGLPADRRRHGAVSARLGLRCGRGR